MGTTVKISEETRRRLGLFKYRKRFKTLNDAIEHLLNKYDEENGEPEAKTEAAEQPARTG